MSDELSAQITQAEVDSIRDPERRAQAQRQLEDGHLESDARSPFSERGDSFRPRTTGLDQLPTLKRDDETGRKEESSDPVKQLIEFSKKGNDRDAAEDFDRNSDRLPRAA